MELPSFQLTVINTAPGKWNKWNDANWGWNILEHDFPLKRVDSQDRAVGMADIDPHLAGQATSLPLGPPFPPRFLPLPPPFPFSRGSLSSWQGHGCGKRPRGAAPRCFGFRANCTKPVFFPVRSVWWLPANFPPSNSIGSSGRSFFPDWNSILTADRPTQPTIAGWWLTYPSEKYESQLGWLISQYMEQIKRFQTSKQYRYSIVFWCYHVASIDIL